MSGSASTEEVSSSSEYWKERRQGDVLPVRTLPVIGAFLQNYPTPNGVVIISQTCDVVLRNRPNVLVAAVSQLSTLDAAAAREGARPRYVHIPLLGDEYFADLEYVATIDKSQVTDLAFTRGLDGTSDDAVRTFALAIARRFGRFPFPDEVGAWLRPLRGAVEDKYDKPNSGLGRALKCIVELRVESANWQLFPVDITLHVIVRAGTLPNLTDDEFVEIPDELGRWLRPNGVLTRPLGEIANRIYRYDLGNGAAPSPVEKYHLWLALGEAFAARCRPKGADAEDSSITASVASVSGVVSSEDEFSLVQCHRSETLDLDHLSAPPPFVS